MGFSFVYATYCVCCMLDFIALFICVCVRCHGRFRTVAVTLLSTVLVLSVLPKAKWDTELLERQHACTPLTCGESVYGAMAVQLFWLLASTDDACWQCLCFLRSLLMHTAWTVFVRTVALSVSSRPSAICFFWYRPPPTRHTPLLLSALHSHPSLSSIASSFLQHCHVCSSILCVARMTCSSANAQLDVEEQLFRAKVFLVAWYGDACTGLFVNIDVFLV